MGETMATSILECSSIGDRRFSAFYAYVEVFGKKDSIERHYQNSKRFYDNTIVKPKGLQPDYMEINNIQFDKKYLTSWYKLLWVKYLDKHKELVEYAKTFDDFNDIFKGKKSINCQADVIRQYVKQGRNSIMKEQDTIELLGLLKKIT